MNIEKLTEKTEQALGELMPILSYTDLLIMAAYADNADFLRMLLAEIKRRECTDEIQ